MGNAQKLWSCETQWAKQFLSAIGFSKDNVFARCILYKTVGDIFTAGVVYHKSCMTNFIVKLQRNVNKIFPCNDEYCEIRVVIEAWVEVVIALEHSKKFI